jgi:terminase small subunit-like protein
VQYTQARDAGLDVMADEVLEISDRTSLPAVGRDRLRFDARRWYLSKLAPKRYGDQVRVETTGKDGGPIEHKDVTALEQATDAGEMAKAYLRVVGGTDTK